MHDQTSITPIAPPMLESAAREAFPDEAVLDCLLEYLKQHRPMLAEIKAAICDFYRILPVELMNRRRTSETVLVRQIFCYLAFKYTRFSLKQIGLEVNVADHTTVRHSFHRIEALAANNPLLRDDLDLLRARISEKILLRLGRRQSC